MNFLAIKQGAADPHALHHGGAVRHGAATRQPDTVTILEEEKIMAYYGGGSFYARPGRTEPLL